MSLRSISISKLYITVAVYSLVANFAHPITPTFIQELGLNDYMFGVAFACMSLTNFLFSPFWGKISHNFGVVKTMGFCYVGYALSQLAFGLSTSELGIIIARLVGGFFIGGITVDQILYIMDYSSSQTVGQNLANNVTINVILAAFGYMVGGFLGNISTIFTFMVQAIGLFLTGVLCFVLLEDDEAYRTKMPLKEVVKSSNPFSAIIASRKIMSVMIIFFLAVCILTSFASTSYEQCFNYFIKDQYGFPPSYNGILKALVGIITLVANMTICRYLMKKTDITKTIIPVLIVCFMMMVSIVILEDVVPFIIMNVVFFGFNAVYQPLLQAMISLMNKSDDGILVGLYNSMRSLGNVGGSLIAGFIYSYGAKMSFVLSAIAFLLAIFFAAMYYLTYRRKASS